jgi:hypothetical protein|tara:strand:+ start:9482 stop:9739 length:258 start_codon:yes stop_codon:yes gene_type:complete
MKLIVSKVNDNVASVELDNGLTVYVDNSTGKSIVHIIGDNSKGHPNVLGEDASCEFKLIDGVICENSFPSNVEIKNLTKILKGVE